MSKSAGSEIYLLAVSYADVMLMSASICKLQDKLDIGYEYGHKIELMFNDRKSMYIMFRKRLSNIPLPMIRNTKNMLSKIAFFVCPKLKILDKQICPQFFFYFSVFYICC